MGLHHKFITFLAISLALFQHLGHCQELPCGSHQENVYSFTINASSPVGNINLMYVQHDATRMIPLSTTVLHDSLNMEQNFNRQDDFRRHPCPAILERQTTCSTTYKMTPEQTAISGGSRTAFDRGHVTPANPYRFSEDALSSTFYCVNIAPQDPYTNQHPWFTVEDRAHKYFATGQAGYVMTGVCDDNDRYSPTRDGYIIPSCFWKLICYVDNSGETQVVGFIGNNTLLHDQDSVGKAQRTADTTYPRGQRDILNVMNRHTLIRAAWDGASQFLRRNRNSANLPLPGAENCKSKLYISLGVENEWRSLMTESLMEHEFPEDVDMELVKEFWKAK